MSSAELDLDYLEDAHLRRRRKRLSSPSQELSPDSVDLVKIIILGAAGVGKTSIIQQFVWNEFDERYFQTDKKRTYYPSVIINDRLYELKISDIPVIPYFPVNAYYEWTDYRFYGLRSATAYILVFDLSVVDTFEYIKTIREQLMESRDMTDVPVIVVGNKQDLTHEAGTSQAESKRDSIVSIIKQWEHTYYVECSAKFNSKVMYLFKQLMMLVDSSYTLEPETDQLEGLLEQGLDDDSKAKCNII